MIAGMHARAVFQETFSGMSGYVSPMHRSVISAETEYGQVSYGSVWSYGSALSGGRLYGVDDFGDPRVGATGLFFGQFNIWGSNQNESHRKSEQAAYPFPYIALEVVTSGTQGSWPVYIAIAQYLSSAWGWWDAQPSGTRFTLAITPDGVRGYVDGSLQFSDSINVGTFVAWDSFQFFLYESAAATVEGFTIYERSSTPFPDPEGYTPFFTSRRNVREYA